MPEVALHVTPAAPKSLATAALNASVRVTVSAPRNGVIVTPMVLAGVVALAVVE